MLIPPTQNPKALALFLSAALKLRRVAPSQADGASRADDRAAHRPAVDRHVLLVLGLQLSVADAHAASCRAATPNLVCTTFVAGALLDAYEAARRRALPARWPSSAADYILNELYRNGWPGRPASATRCRRCSRRFTTRTSWPRRCCAASTALTGDAKFLEPALKVARYSASRQRQDGSWTYGEGDTQQWIDNFHTGYNLCALRDIGRMLETTEFDAAHPARASSSTERISSGRTAPPGTSTTAPIRSTSTAWRRASSRSLTFETSIRTTGSWRMPRLDWAMDHMWDERGFFYYRVLRFGTIRTSYMRWSQAWMLLALATLLDDEPLTTLTAASGRRRTASGRNAMPYTYVLVTPARNEAQFIELTLKSVIGQTVRPAKWVIVSDGSTDGTDDIVAPLRRRAPVDRAACGCRSGRSGISPARSHAFNAGYARLARPELRRHRQPGWRHLVRRRLLRFPAEKFAENPRLGRRRHAVQRRLVPVRLPVHEHRARLRRSASCSGGHASRTSAAITAGKSGASI